MEDIDVLDRIESIRDLVNANLESIIEEKIATLQHKGADTRATIELYKNWQDGSRMQQITRKKSFEKNSKILNDLEKKLLVFKKILRGYQQ